MVPGLGLLAIAVELGGLPRELPSAEVYAGDAEVVAMLLGKTPVEAFREGLTQGLLLAAKVVCDTAKAVAEGAKQRVEENALRAKLAPSTGTVQ
jgi:hypothetical protein